MILIHSQDEDSQAQGSNENDIIPAVHKGRAQKDEADILHIDDLSRFQMNERRENTGRQEKKFLALEETICEEFATAAFSQQVDPP